MKRDHGGRFFRPRFPDAAMATGAANRNEGYKQALADLVKANHEAFARLRISMSVTYWLLLVLLTIMFLVGVFLIVMGAEGVATSGGDELAVGDLAAVGAGGADLLLLGLARPVERIRQIKSDRAQLFVMLSDYHVQTTTALLWYKADDRRTILQAADRIRDLTLETVHMIEAYMHVGPMNPGVTRDALSRLEDQNRQVAAAVQGALGAVDGAKGTVDGLASTLRRSPRGVL